MAACNESLHAEGEKRLNSPPAAANTEWLLVSKVLYTSRPELIFNKLRNCHVYVRNNVLPYNDVIETIL